MRKIVIILLCIATANTILAQSLEELQAEQRRYAEQIEQTGKMLNETKKNEKSTQNKLNLISQDIKTRKKLIRSITAELTALDKQRNELQANKAQLEHELDSLKQDYAKLVNMTHYAAMQQSPLLFILSADNFNQLTRRIRYMHEFSMYRQVQVAQIESLKEDIDLQTTLLDENRKEKDRTLQAQQREKDKLARNERQHKSMLNELKKQEKSLKKKQQQQQKKIDELNSKIEKLIAQQVDRKTQLTKEQELIAGGFEANKGRLPWPVEKGYISSHFGKHQHPVYENVTINNKGTYIQTTAGARARAVYEGDVTTCMVMGATYAIIIQHGNYRTVYTGIAKPSVKPGDHVTAKQTIGTIASDPDEDNKTELQFQVWKDRTLLNPELWIAQ